MEQAAIQQTIASVSERLTRGGYAKSTINHFKNTANHLVEYMKSADIEAYTTEVGIRFLEARYGFDVNVVPSHNEASKLRLLRKLSEYQLHGTIVMKRISGYDIPKGFSEVTAAFLSYRRFEGIVEKNIGTISLYLERYFEYLTSQKVTQIPQVTGRHIHGFLRFIT